MTALSDIIKDGLAYPMANAKNTIITGILFLLSIVLFIFGSYFISNDVHSQLVTNPIEDYNNLSQILGQASPTAYAILIITAILSFICYLFVQGYFFRIYENTVFERKEAVEYDEPKSLLVEGFKLFIVNISYLIIPSIVISAGIYYNAVVLAVGIILVILAYLTLPIVVSNMIYKKSFKSAYRFGEIRSIIESIGVQKYIGTILFGYLVCGIILASWSIIFLLYTALLVNLPIESIIFIAIPVVISTVLYAYLFSFTVRINGSLYIDRKEI